MKTALLFPGQGSQKVGMGKELADTFETARRTFEEADEALGFSISALCFDGPAEDLTLTTNTQPAILTTSVAVLRVLEQEKGLAADIAAGHSLGEWSALVAAGALGFADAVRLVNLRGKAMQEAVPAGQGAMAAIIGMTDEAVRELCAEVRQDDVIEPANFNGGGQIVISGSAAAIDRAVEIAKPRGARLAKKLAVSAPFHCPLMQPAAERMAEALTGIDIGALRMPVVANVDARENSDSGRIKDLLVAQVTGAVLWNQSVERLVELGVGRAVEVGAGTVLKGLVKRIAKELPVVPVGAPSDVAALEL